jgi:FixJ family two-component response regulator
MPPKPEVVAVIDDDLRVRRATGRLLLALGYNTELYASAGEFLDAVMATRAICLIVDIELGKSSGIEFTQGLRNAGFTTPIIFVTADCENESYKRRALEMGCVGFFCKPYSADVLIEALLSIPRGP